MTKTIRPRTRTTKRATRIWARARGCAEKRLPVKFRKAGARNSAADQELIQNVHDTSVELGAECAPQKRAGGTFGEAPRLLGAALVDILQRVKNIEIAAAASAALGRTRAVSKAEDAGFEESVEKLSPIPRRFRFSPSRSRSATAAAF